jgi:predicted aspartyl protease
LVEAFVDKGFNGHLAIPISLAQQLGLKVSGSTVGRVADGRMDWGPIYQVSLDWLDRVVTPQAVGSDLPHVLIGTALMDGGVLTIDFPAKTVEIR